VADRRTEFGDDSFKNDPDIFIPRQIGRVAPKSLYLVSLDQNRGTVTLTSAHTVNELDRSHLEALIESLQEVKDFLEDHPHLNL